MRAPLRRRYLLPFVPFVLVGLVMVVGGLFDSVNAHGRVVDDTDSSPVPNIAVYYGSRVVVTGPDGAYTMNDLPRGASLVAQNPGYARSSTSPESTELRLMPLTITFEVKDATTGKGINMPEARQPATVRVGQGTNSGEMVVGPYPNRDQPVTICAKDYQSKDVMARGVLMTVELQPGGTGCPPLPSSPPPAQVTPSPSGSPSESPSATPAPTATP
ncbi:MAG: hypothetical protein KGJ98_07525 [Chloroflexota bacterium]|nr:hypothetical protein [Chloroflexota bacterium]